LRSRAIDSIVEEETLSTANCGDNLNITPKKRIEFKFKVANIGSGKIIGLEILEDHGGNSTAICDSNFSEVYSISTQNLMEIVHNEMIWSLILERASELNNSYQHKIEKLQSFIQDI
jgi:hypothetical protein